jgi:hypothetical protein
LETESAFFEIKTRPVDVAVQSVLVSLGALVTTPITPPWSVEPQFDVRALTWSRACARGIEHGDDARRSPHKAVKHGARRKVNSRDHSRCIDASWLGLATAGNIERSNRAIRSTHKAVRHALRVIEYSRNGPRGVDAMPKRSLSAGRVETCYITVSSAHKSVIHVAPISVFSCNSASRVYADAEGSLICACACVGCIKSCYRPIGSTHEAVGRVIRVGHDVYAALALAPTQDVKVLAAIALTRIHETSRTQALAEELEKRSPSITVLKLYWLPTIKAAIELGKGNYSQALVYLEAAAPYELAFPPPFLPGTMYPAYLRGQAYL